jgi:hypothetical protein
MGNRVDALARLRRARGWRVAARTSLALGSLWAVVRWGLGPTSAIAAVILIVGVSVGIMVDLKMVGRAVRASVVVTGVLLTSCAALADLTWSDVVLLVPLAAAGWLLLASGTDSVAGVEEAEESSAQESGAAATHEPERDRQDMTDAELCQRWRRSFTALADARTPGERLEVVRTRQAYLDEIERRHPAELQTWLASGARAAGNPMPFLTRKASGPPQE